jgi:hypothetical protein
LSSNEEFTTAPRFVGADQSEYLGEDSIDKVRVTEASRIARGATRTPPAKRFLLEWFIVSLSFLSLQRAVTLRSIASPAQQVIDFIAET